ncbi:putative RNA-directed DNA polymerase [Arabidopsis thaliana]
MRDTQTDRAIYLLLYVDDMLIASGNMAVIRELKNKLNCEFEMKDLGKASRILGMDIIRVKEKGELILSQGNYLKKVLKTFGMLEARPMITPTAAHFKLRSLSEEEKKTEAVHMERIPYASAVGSLMYAMVGSRPDLVFAVGFISRFISSPGREHWSAVKWVLRYLKGAYTQNLIFKKDSKFCMEGFSYSDYATDLDRRRSVTRYVFKVGGNTISWKSSLQSVVALSTTAAEYMALTEAVKEAIWLKVL